MGSQKPKKGVDNHQYSCLVVDDSGGKLLTVFPQDMLSKTLEMMTAYHHSTLFWIRSSFKFVHKNQKATKRSAFVMEFCLLGFLLGLPATEANRIFQSTSRYFLVNVAPAQTKVPNSRALNESDAFSLVRQDIPTIPILDGIYTPMSSLSSDRYEFMIKQYETWFHTCAPTADGILRGNNTAECWRYDPSKTLYELARRIELVNKNETDLYYTALLDAQVTAQEFLLRQDFEGSTGAWPDCAGGVRDMPGVDACDMKYWGHASAAWFQHTVHEASYAYTQEQAELMKEYCFEQGWAAGFVNVDDLSDLYTERWSGLALQCLVDLYKANITDVSAELATAIDYQYAMFTGNYSSEVIGAPMHSLDGHECSGYCPNMRYWIFSPWMGSSFLIPALWEYYVFVDHDPRVPELLVLFGDALMKHGIVKPEVWTQGLRDARTWMLRENPTDWLTLYFGNPYNLSQAIIDQDSEGWFSDTHNPESIFALSVAYFFSCNEEFKERVEQMWGFFNVDNAVGNSVPLRMFLWQHRGSASTEWLLENADCAF